MRAKYRYLISVYIMVIVSMMIIGVLGSKAITAASMSAPVHNRKILIIDAGHGGEDGGATSCTGVLESKINLDIALRLRDVAQLLGCKTVLLRDSDQALHTEGQTIAARKVSDLKRRVQLINEAENAILISIHQNHYSDSRYSGAQVFYGKVTESKNLAQNIQNALQKTLQKNNTRQIKPAEGIYLMQHIQTPGVLIECGFISNPEEETMLRDVEYQKKLCCVIAATYSCFRNEEICST